MNNLDCLWKISCSLRKNINIYSIFWISGLPEVCDMATIGHKNCQPKHLFSIVFNR